MSLVAAILLASTSLDITVWLVRASFSRTDGCELARWNRVRFLSPGVPASNSR